MLNVPQRKKNNREYREFMRVDLLSERELRERFRFGREAIVFLCDLLRSQLERSTKKSPCPDGRTAGLNCIEILCKWRQSSKCVDKSTVSRVIDDVTDLLLMLIKTSSNEKRRSRNGFYQLGGFPNVIGCIDGTHIRIQAPAEDEKSFVNRMNFHCINVMAVCGDKGIQLGFKSNNPT